MNQAVHNKLVSFIWSIADDCLRDVYVRGKYRDVILPMLVLRRLDALLEPRLDAVQDELQSWKEASMSDALDSVLRETTGYKFYNTSRWTLAKLCATATNDWRILAGHIEEYLNGFSRDVQEVIHCFNLHAQVRKMAEKDVLLGVLEKFTSPDINLTPEEKTDSQGRKLPPLTNLGMGYVFEELIRRFNEENNEEAGEHFTPREVIDLMTHMVFEPLHGKLPGIVTIYDPACGSGGMLTEAQNFITDPEGRIRMEQSGVVLYGKEVNDETYAICKSDMLIKGNSPENIYLGSTLASNSFGDLKFEFMLSNPPYGKSWANDQKYILSDGEVIDPRFRVQLRDFDGVMQDCEAVPRSSDGQLLFLMDMVSRMKSVKANGMGARIASVHNGSSLFTGDAGGGESNIRRFLIENDLLDAIIQLPNNLFYNTGITTYIWLLNNHKAAERRGKVQLIDASLLYAKLRKNLGQKNCELRPEHISEILRVYLGGESVERLPDPVTGEEAGIAARMFDNADFGYYKVTVERPKRLCAQLSQERIDALRFYDRGLREPMTYAWSTWGDVVYTDLKRHMPALKHWCEQEGLDLNARHLKNLESPEFWARGRRLMELAERLRKSLGEAVWKDFNAFTEAVEKELRGAREKLAVQERNALYAALSWYDASAAPVIKKRHILRDDEVADLLITLQCEAEHLLPHYGWYPTGKKGEYLEYESESDLRDTENIPLQEDIHAYFQREVLPWVPEAWLNTPVTKIGYEISFNKYFYRHKPLRSLEAVTADILQLEAESDGLIRDILNLG